MRLSPVLLAASCLLAACATAPAPPAGPEALLADPLFAPPSEPIRTDDLFAMSDAMRRYLAVDIADQLRIEGKQVGLMEALRSQAQLKLEYDAARTKKAAATFDTRTGNCLSLVIMTAAFAKELRLPVSYRSAYLEESWSRSGSLLISTGHVNITVGRRILDAKTQRDLSPITIDFLPPEEISGLRSRDIDEATVIAMYANNRAAEALAEGRLDDAYAWAAESVRRDPTLRRRLQHARRRLPAPRQPRPGRARLRARPRRRAEGHARARQPGRDLRPPRAQRRRRRRRGSAWPRSSRIRRSTSSTSAWRRCARKTFAPRASCSRARSRAPTRTTSSTSGSASPTGASATRPRRDATSRSPWTTA